VEAGAEIELDGQYRELREGAGWLARERAIITVDGPDAAEFLQGQLTNDIEALAASEGCYAAILDRKGHLRADMRVLNIEGGPIWLDLEPECGADVLGALNMYSVGRDVEIADAAGRRAITSVIGPRTPEITGATALRPEHAQRHLQREGIDVLAVATDQGIDLITAPDEARELRAQLTGAGAPEVSAEAAEILRVESGRPRFGREMTSATMPAEAAITERAVSFTKGCYIGQETVARLHYRGRPNRLLRGIRLSAPAVAGEAVLFGEREVGAVGTTVLSPALGPIALAVLRREAEPDVTVSIGAGAVEGRVVELPFMEVD